jgi:hypothetical protein
MATTYNMPIYGSHQALTFNGENENLLHFFENILNHADLARINNANHIKWTV